MTAPVDQARDEYADAMNLELRRSIAANVLEAMDVDQYLIDAVRNAEPPVKPIKPAIEEPTEFGSIVRVTYPPAAVLRFCRTYSVAVDEPWCSGNHLRSWADVLEGASDVEVLRVGIAERLDVAPEDTEDYKAGVSDTAIKVVRWLRQLRAEALTAERQNAYDKAIKLVEELTP